MAAATAPEKVSRGQEDDSLTDEHIDELLARATARLREKANSKDILKNDEQQSYNFPKLQTGQLEKPYVSSNGNVATVDAPRLLEEKQRKQANGIRRVEEPVAAKKLALEVCERTSILVI